MQLTPDEDALMRRLFTKIQRQKPEDRKNLDYYRGLQNIGNLGISVPPDVQPFAFPLNWCRTYIDVLEERMDVRLILRQGTGVEDAELRRDWEANDLGTESQMAHRDLLVYGRAFISVAADPAGGRPRIRVESPRDMAAEVDSLTREMVGALRLYRDELGYADHMTLYLPDSTVMIDRKAGKWDAVQRIKHGLGRVPVVMMLNRRQTGRWTGETQMSDLRPIVDMGGRVMLQLQLAMETVASPQKIAVGVKTEDFKRPDGTPVTDVWEQYLGAVWALTSEQAKVTQLDGASLTNFHDTIKMLAEQASTVTGLPVRMMGQSSANPPAEGAIRADESRLVRQVERVNSVAGAGWAWALGIAERIRTRSWASDGLISLEWHNPGTPTVAQRADYIQKLTGGLPVLSQRGGMNEIGWSQPRIDQELKWMAGESEDAVPAEEDRKLTREAV